MVLAITGDYLSVSDGKPTEIPFSVATGNEVEAARALVSVTELSGSSKIGRICGSEVNLRPKSLLEGWESASANDLRRSGFPQAGCPSLSIFIPGFRGHRLI